MLSKKSFTIATTFFVVFLVGHPYASGNSCDNNGFHPEEKGQYLQHHVIDAMTTETVSLCRIMCYLQESCTSYNYQPSTGSCELSDSDEIKHPKDLIPSHSDHVYVKRENPCHKNPCPEYQVCKPNFKERSRGCSCQHDYASPTCKDIDECATGQHDCSPNADCSNTIGSHNCECKDGYHGNGKTCKVSVSCKELLSAGYRDDGVYTINPDGQGSFPVYCDMTTDGGGWTVFQRNRKDSPTSFNHNWQEYKTGLGKVTGEFWLGLDKIYRLTKAQAATLRVELEDDQGKKGYAVYSSFSVADESDFYRLNVSGFSGTAGDSITTAHNRDWINNKMKFSTPDKDNDLFTGGSCAFERNAGWWYNWCSNSDLNGAMTWWTFNKTLMNTEMKLK